MRGYVLTCGPLVVPLCGEHVHQGIINVQHLPADFRLVHGPAEDCTLCAQEPE